MSALDDLFERFVSRISGRTVVVLAILFYFGLGLALPLALDWSVADLVVANVLGTGFAGLLIIGWLEARVRAIHRRHLLEWTTNLRLLTAAEFEWLVGEMFRREGWQVRETGRQDGPDGNIDLELTRSAERAVVQCKRWTAQVVGVNVIRAFAGTLMREGFAGSEGVFVTLSEFTQQAQDEAHKIRMTLIDNHSLFSHIEKVRRVERCDICQKPMILDRSSRGWWLRCVAAGCKGKRDLGSDPNRAVDLLTQFP